MFRTRRRPVPRQTGQHGSTVGPGTSPALRRAPAAFRAAPSAVPADRPSRQQAVALLVVLALVLGTIVVVSYVVRPDRARSFDLFHGSVFLADSVAPVAVDLASGHPTVRLINADAQVGARSGADLAVTPLDQGTLLLNRTTGEFNVVAATGFVAKTDGGVPIAQRVGATGATAISSGDLAYIVQTGPTGTSVYLVGQSTVETASNVAARVRPRAFRSMTDAGSTEPGAAASAAGSLWLLLGDGQQRVVRQLRVPANSSTGATLRSTDHGRVTGPAALASAAGPTRSSADSSVGSPSAVVGVASADRIRVFRGSTTIATARYPAVAGLDRVVAATNGQDRLSFLLHGSAGWSVVSVGVDGHALRGPTRLTGLSAGAALTAPAASNDALYTMDTTTGALVRIDAAGRAAAIGGAPSYPLAEQGGRVVEPGGFADGYVIARGSRVIYNSPTHLNALVVFTDGSHRPLTIEKSSAVSVSAAGGAESLTRSRVDAGASRSTPTAKAQPKASNPVNNKIDCKAVRQKPHIPTIVGATPGSRSVALSWTYPLLSPQDCAPSTYQLSVKLLSADAPSPPSTVTVQGQQSVNLAGLFPSTQYEISVGAFINGQGTESAPRRVTTGPEGPAAPEDVSASTDAAGNWNVAFSSCGSTRTGCVPASSWKVIPEFCDGRGLSGAPAAIAVTADPTSVRQPTAQLRGGDALLGRGLRFQVEGTGAQGSVGEPSGYTACTYSWAPPVAADLSLKASTAPLGQLGSTTSAAVTLDITGDPVHATGGVGAQYTYTLLSGGNTVRTLGPSTDTTVRFTGINAGQKYTVRATVAPPRHADAAVTVGPVAVDGAIAPWPDVSARVTSVDDDSSGTMATYKLQIGGLTSAAARGETFALAGALRCGNSSDAVAAKDIDPADALTFTTDRTQNNYGSCRVDLQLTQSGSLTDPPLFGAGTSSGPVSTPSFQIAAPSLPVLGANGNFAARWTGSGSSSAVALTPGNALIGLFGADFNVTVTDPGGHRCGSVSGGGSGSLGSIDVDQSCVDTYGSTGDQWIVTIAHFSFFGASQGPFTVQGISGGAAPSYTPPVCDLDAAGLTAAWSGNAAAPKIAVGVRDSTKIKNCGSSWTYAVNAPSGDCGNGSGVPAQTVPVTCSDTPTTPGWTVTVTYQDIDGSSRTAPAVAVTGDPPN